VPLIDCKRLPESPFYALMNTQGRNARITVQRVTNPPAVNTHTPQRLANANSAADGFFQPRVAVVLLNYTHADKTLRCIESLTRLNADNLYILVVDNASPDDSLTRLKASPLPFTLIESPVNGGYSAGCNLGIQAALTLGADYVWLLNNDAWVQPDSLRPLLIESQQTGGLAGSVLRYPDGRYQQVGSRVTFWTGRVRGYPEGSLHDGMPVQLLSGASMIIPVSVFQHIGLLAEEYFLYFEDGDFCERARRAGFACTLALGSTVFHEEGGTTGRQLPPYYYQRNRLIFCSRFGTVLQKSILLLYTLYRLIRAWMKAVLRYGTTWQPTAWHHATLMTRAFSDFLRGVRGPLKETIS
jgi:GT2 family glycosyltransferase